MTEEKPVCPCCAQPYLPLAVMLYGTTNLKLCEECESRVNEEVDDERD